MTGMTTFRNNRIRRGLAGSLAVMWLFTVMACAFDSDAAVVGGLQTSQHLALDAAQHRGDGDSLDDACCQLQAGTLASFDVVKLPPAGALLALVSIVLLLSFAVRETESSVPVAPGHDAVRRRFEFLVHSLQAQAPPR